jgi:hypothetical protein
VHTGQCGKSRVKAQIGRPNLERPTSQLTGSPHCLCRMRVRVPSHLEWPSDMRSALGGNLRPYGLVKTRSGQIAEIGGRCLSRCIGFALASARSETLFRGIFTSLTSRSVRIGASWGLLLPVQIQPVQLPPTEIQQPFSSYIMSYMYLRSLFILAAPSCAEPACRQRRLSLPECLQASSPLHILTLCAKWTVNCSL